MNGRTTSRRLELIILALSASACQFLFADSSPQGCLDNLDCVLGQVCDTASGTCIPSNSFKPLSVVDAQVTPPKSSSTATTQFAAIDLKTVDSQNLELVLQRAVLLEGTIASPDAPGGVPGMLAAVRRPLFDNRTLSFNITVSESGFFSQQVAPGKYRLLFKPSRREAFPQLVLEPATVGGGEVPLPRYLPFADPQTDDLQDQDPLLVVRGQILASQTQPHPVAGLQVEAVTAAGLRSSLAQPDEQGFFYLRLPLAWQVTEDGDLEATTPASANIVISPAGAEVRLPTVEITDVALDTPDLGVFYLGEVPPVHALSGVVLDAHGRPVADCQLKLRVEPVAAGSFTMLINNDSTGHFATTLPAGQLTVTVIPPAVGEVALASFDLLLDADRQVQLTLPPRPLLSGQVTDDAGLPVADVIVRAERISTTAGEDDGIYSSFEAGSGSDGIFAMSVDPGRYRVVFLPPAASGLPRSLPKVAYVQQDTVMEAAACRLSPPTLVSGRILDGAGQPVCGASVQFFYSPDDSTSHLVGESISGGIIEECSGNFSLLLPADVPVER